MHASWKFYNYGHDCILEKRFFGWLGFSPSFGKDFDNEVAIEQLTAVVDASTCYINATLWSESILIGWSQDSLTKDSMIEHK